MNLKLFIPSIAIPLLAGFIGSYFTISSINTWYVTLTKPSFNPPNFVFGPVWTILYILMGISLYLVLSSKKKKDFALKLFSAQLILNASWSLVFFGLHNLLLSLINIVLLWIAIVWTIKEFIKINKTAGYLLIPYILWVSFASILNFSIFLLNR